MYTFMNMVMTRVKYRSPDMILAASDRKFDEKKEEIPSYPSLPITRLSLYPPTPLPLYRSTLYL